MARLSRTSLSGDGNLVAYYPFDGNSDDANNGKDGTDTNMSYVSGKWSQAADFNGTTSKIVVSSFSNDFFSNEGTAAGWINLDSIANAECIVSFDAGNTAKITVEDVSGNDADIRFTQFCAVTDGIWQTNSRVTVVGSWVHLAVIYDRSGGVGANPTIYVNGSSVAITETQTPVAALRTSIDEVYFGTLGASGTSWADGKFDDWAFFDDALTQGEIDELVADEPAIGGNPMIFSNSGVTIG
ncbi:MAG: LamG domain-containing protein [bacterium]|nr:LamG domain-containing protein [bacterium]